MGISAEASHLAGKATEAAKEAVQIVQGATSMVQQHHATLYDCSGCSIHGTCNRLMSLNPTLTDLETNLSVIRG